MEDVRVAATIIHLPDSYIMRHRKTGNDKGEEGKFGLYGGQVEETDRDAQHTARRELEEESGLQFPLQGFDYQGFVHVKSERGGEEILTEAEIFLLLPSGFSAGEFNNGLRMSPRQISRARALGQLSSVASASLSKFMGV